MATRNRRVKPAEAVDETVVEEGIIEGTPIKGFKKKAVSKRAVPKKAEPVIHITKVPCEGECDCCDGDCDCDCHVDEVPVCDKCCSGERTVTYREEDTGAYVRIKDPKHARDVILYLTDYAFIKAKTSFQRNAPRAGADAMTFNTFLDYAHEAVNFIAAATVDRPGYDFLNEDFAFPPAWVVPTEDTGSRVSPKELLSSRIRMKGRDFYNESDLLVKSGRPKCITDDQYSFRNQYTDTIFGKGSFTEEDAQQPLDLFKNEFPSARHAWAWLLLLTYMGRSRSDSPRNITRMPKGRVDDPNLFRVWWESNSRDRRRYMEKDFQIYWRMDASDLASMLDNGAFDSRSTTTSIYHATDRYNVRINAQAQLNTVATYSMLPLLIPVSAMESQAALLAHLELNNFKLDLRSEDEKEDELVQRARALFKLDAPVANRKTYGLVGPAIIEGIHYNVTPETAARAQEFLIEGEWSTIADYINGIDDVDDDAFYPNIHGGVGVVRKGAVNPTSPWIRLNHGEVPPCLKIGDVFVATSPLLSYPIVRNQFASAPADMSEILKSIQRRQSASLLRNYVRAEEELDRLVRHVIELRGNRNRLARQITDMINRVEFDVMTSVSRLNDLPIVEAVEFLPNGCVLVQTNDVYYTSPNDFSLSAAQRAEARAMDDEDEGEVIDDSDTLPFYIGKFQIVMDLNEDRIAMRNVAAPCGVYVGESRIQDYQERLHICLHPHSNMDVSSASPPEMCMGSYHSEMGESTGLALESSASFLEYKVQLLYTFLSQPNAGDAYVRSWQALQRDTRKPAPEFLTVSPWRNVVGSLAHEMTRPAKEGMLAMISTTENPKHRDLLRLANHFGLSLHKQAQANGMKDTIAPLQRMWEVVGDRIRTEHKLTLEEALDELNAKELTREGKKRAWDEDLPPKKAARSYEDDEVCDEDDDEEEDTCRACGESGAWCECG